MSACVSSDITALKNSETSLTNCVDSAMAGGSAMIPAGSVIQNCMNTAGISTGCSQCWANLFDNVKVCIMDTCGLAAAMASEGQPPSMTKPSQPCIDCLTNLSNNFETTMCGINPTEMGVMGDAVRNQVGNLLPRDGNSTTITTTGKSAATTTLSLRSITTTLFVFTLIIVSI
jgi:hypothetical protein